MTDAQVTSSSTTATTPVAAGGNPVTPAGARRAGDVVTPELVARLTRGVAGSGRTANHTPFTGEQLAELPESTPQDVAAAFERAREAQRAWAATPVRSRAAVMLRFHDLVLRRQDEVLDIIQLETGKARLHAHEEVQAVAVAARHYGHKAPGYLAPKRHTGAIPVLTRVTELRHPRGVVGQIAPWNYPLELSIGDALPAFVAGNAVVMKPDTETALTALWAREQMIEAGLPEAVWQIVIGEGPVVGPAVVEHADYVSFTGSTRTGRDVATRAAARLIGASLELGGKNAMLVLADADLDRAAEGAVRACFSSAGQLCISIERLYVHASVADAFLEKFAARTRALRLGTALAYGAGMGSLAGERQLDAVIRHVEEAVAKGRHRARRRPRPAGRRPVLLRADHPGRGRGADGGVHRGDLRTGRLRLPLPRRGRGRRPGQRHPLRPQRERVDAATPAAPPGSPPRLRTGHRQRQRGLRGRLRQRAGADGRHEGLRPRPAARLGGHPQVHRGADRRHPAAAADGTVAGDDRRAVRGPDEPQPAGDEGAAAALTGAPGESRPAPPK